VKLNFLIKEKLDGTKISGGKITNVIPTKERKYDFLLENVE